MDRLYVIPIISSFINSRPNSACYQQRALNEIKNTYKLETRNLSQSSSTLVLV